MTIKTPGQETLEQLELELAGARADLDAWLDRHAPADFVRTLTGGELEGAYPGWDAVRTLLGRIYRAGVLAELSSEAAADLVFCASRSVEINLAVNWMQPEAKRLSTAGPLDPDGLLSLCEIALALPEDDLDYQLAAGFQNLEVLTPAHAAMLERLFARDFQYTKRRALGALAHFEHPGVSDLADVLWDLRFEPAEDEEFAKLTCLYCLKRVAPGSEQFQRRFEEYQRLFDPSQESYRRTHLERLKA